MGADCLDVRNRRAGNSNKRLAYRQNYFTHHINIITAQERVNTVRYRAADGVFLRYHGVIGYSSCRILDSLVNGTLRNEAASGNKEEFRCFLGVCTLWTEIAYRSIIFDHRPDRSRRVSGVSAGRQHKHGSHYC